MTYEEWLRRTAPDATPEECAAARRSIESALAKDLAEIQASPGGDLERQAQRVFRALCDERGEDAARALFRVIGKKSRGRPRAGQPSRKVLAMLDAADNSAGEPITQLNQSKYRNEIRKAAIPASPGQPNASRARKDTTEEANSKALRRAIVARTPLVISDNVNARLDAIDEQETNDKRRAAEKAAREMRRKVRRPDKK